MKSRTLLLGIGLLGIAIAGVVGAHDRDGRFRIATTLKPSEEVPAVSSAVRVASTAWPLPRPSRKSWS